MNRKKTVPTETGGARNIEIRHRRLAELDFYKIVTYSEKEAKLSFIL